jgi:hypothetical protein
LKESVMKSVVLANCWTVECPSRKPNCSLGRKPASRMNSSIGSRRSLSKIFPKPSRREMGRKSPVSSSFPCLFGMQAIFALF